MAFDKALIAPGARPANLPGVYLESPRLMTSTNALELDGTQLTAMGGESDQYGSQGVFAGEEIIVKNGASAVHKAETKDGKLFLNDKEFVLN